MKILLLCKKFPFPLKDGESIAVHSLSKSLSELGCEVSLLAMNTSKHHFAGTDWPAEMAHFRYVETVEVDNRLRPRDALCNLLSGESYHISRFVSEAYGAALRRLLERETFDVIQLETLYLAPYLPLIRSLSEATVAMRAHDVEHEIWERVCDHTRRGPRKWYLRHLTRQLRAYELAQLNRYDLLIPITERDEQRFRKLGCTIPSVTVPIGLDSENYRPDFASFHRRISLSFIGSLDWMPNVEGLQWFLDKVWPRAARQFPNLELHIAGRNTPEWLLQLKKRNIRVHGEVDRADAFINDHSIMIVPLLSGSGMRAKILEGMALGKVVLTTPVGLEGITARDRQEVMVADSPERFLHALEQCHRMNGQLEQMGRRAQTFVNRRYDRLKVARQLLRAYARLAPVLQE